MKKKDKKLYKVSPGKVNHFITRQGDKSKPTTKNPINEEHFIRILNRLEENLQRNIRNPLNAISAITEALFIKLGDNYQIKPYKNRIRSQISQLKSYMNNLSDIILIIKQENSESDTSEGDF